MVQVELKFEVISQSFWDSPSAQAHISRLNKFSCSGSNWTNNLHVYIWLASSNWKWKCDNNYFVNLLDMTNSISIGCFTSDPKIKMFIDLLIQLYALRCMPTLIITDNHTALTKCEAANDFETCEFVKTICSLERICKIWPICEKKNCPLDWNRIEFESSAISIALSLV